MTEMGMMILAVVGIASVLALLALVYTRVKDVLTVRDLEQRLGHVREISERTERGVRDEIARNREESSVHAKQGREEVLAAFQILSESLLTRMTEIATLQKQQLDIFAQQLTSLTRTNEQKLDNVREAVRVNLKSLEGEIGARLESMKADAASTARSGRDELSASLKTFGESILARIAEMSSLQQQQQQAFSKQLTLMTQTNEQKLEQVRLTVEDKLRMLQEDNSKKLEQMRATVDEKLHATLEQRLGQSFRLVSERLELVHKGLGEMQTLASGVGDLKKVLTNVRTRGTWGEIQLGNLLEQILTPEQYCTNVATKPGSNDRVEFAVKLPGREGDDGKFVFLPMDAKFPQEDYHRLVDAQEKADPELADKAGKFLEDRIKLEAKTIKEKYLAPPHTTDFGIMFLPIESLYAEVLRRPGLCEVLQREYRIVVTGPTTLAALLNSLQMGFRTLAIEKRSSEVWALLAGVKSDFGKFGEILEKTQKKLQEASNTIDDAAKKSRTIERKLRDVQELPQQPTLRLIASADDEALEA